jgi:hypothetical protein
MSASGSLSLLPTGGTNSFTSSNPLPSLGSFRSPPRSRASSSSPSSCSSSDDDRDQDDQVDHRYRYPTIHVSHLTKIIDASLVLKGMATSDDEQKHAAPPSQSSPGRLPRLGLSPLKPDRSANNSPSPGTATATSIAAMSLSYIINDDNSENMPENYRKSKSPLIGSIEDPKVQQQMPKLPKIGDRLQQIDSATTVPMTSSVAPLATARSAGFGVNSILNTVCAKPDCYRTIRGPPGSFCKYHKQSRFCRADNCNKSAKTGGFCISHGGGKRCSFENCTKSAKQGGLCISHGGGKRCSESGCTKSALVGGYCSAHGGGRKCKTSDCSKTALLGGYCIAHGGGKRCQVDGCAKSAVGGHLCVSHGGGKRCQADGCNKGAVRNGVCIRHGAKRDGTTSSNASGSSPNPSPLKAERSHASFSP